MWGIFVDPKAAGRLAQIASRGHPGRWVLVTTQ